jgi:putative tryptophan/tyrosine transport system substrate-binding protein
MFEIRRRKLITLLGGAAAWPLVARAQQTAMPIVGVLFTSPPAVVMRLNLTPAFRQGLNDTGFIEGQNVRIEYRFAEGHYDRLPGMAAELVHRRVAVIATPSITAAALAAKAATQDIPIVFLVGTDPVQIGLVASLNRPGGNLTGVVILSAELAVKRLELLHELVPAATLIAYLSNPTNPIFADAEAREVQAAARVLGMRILMLNASTPNEIEAAFESLIQLQADALLVGGDPFFGVTQRDQLVALAARHRVPAIYDRRENVEAGGLISYGTEITDAVRQVGVYTGRILKGEKPAELPVQQSMKVELIINMKTAKSLDLTFPLNLIGRADKIIE